MTEPDLAAVEEYRKAQEAEYGQYVAAEAISINGVRAFNQFDPVPAGHVEREVVSRDSVITREEYDQLLAAAAGSDPTLTATPTAPAVLVDAKTTTPKTPAAPSATNVKDA
jgi:hypothetical protein